MKIISVFTCLFLFTNSTFADDCVGDCVNGQGTYRYSSGSKYEGEWKNGKRNGQGIYTDKYGNKYEGEWKNGKENGQGVMTYSNGDKYEGEWKNGDIDNTQQGTMTYSNGDKYQGEWKSDRKEGQGTMVYSNGDKYQGEWKNDRKDGQGIMIYSNGDKYEGKWKDDLKRGRGTVTYSNGDKYQSQWKDDQSKKDRATLTKEDEVELQQLQKTLKLNPDDDSVLNRLAFLYVKQDKYEQAEPLYLRSLAIMEKNFSKGQSEILFLLHSLNHLANFYESQGKYEQAEPIYLRKLAIEEKKLGKNHPDITLDLHSLAYLYEKQGKYEQAEPLHLRGLAISEKNFGKDPSDLIFSLSNLAGLYEKQGRYEAAESLYLRRLAIDKKADGLSLLYLANFYQDQGKYEQAEPFYLRALPLVDGTDFDDTAENSHDLNLAELYRIQGKYEQAEPLFIHGLAIAEQYLGENHFSSAPFVAKNLNSLAELYRVQGKYQQAESLYLRSLTLLEKALGKDHPDIARSLDKLANLYNAQGDYNKAEPLLQRSLRIMNQSLERWLWGAGEKTRQSYLQKQDDKRNFYLNFYVLHNLSEEALYFSLSRKGLLLRITSEMNALAKQSTDPAIQKQTQEFNALKAQLASLAFSGKAEDKAKIEALTEKINTLEMQLSQKVAGFKRSKTEVIPKEVLAKLKSEQALVDFLVYTEVDLETEKNKTEQLIALIANKENGIKLIKLGELAPIIEAIKTYRQNVLPTPQGQLANRDDILKPASQKLYELIWQPLLPYLNNKKQVYLIPDGILHLLPFKALQDKQGHYLAESQQITLLTSARDIVLPPVTGKNNDSVIFAAPAYGGKEIKTNNQPTRSIATRQQDIYFAPLDGAEAEGKTISELIKAKQPIQFFQGLQASETTVEAIKSPRLLHFATHGFFLENLPQPSATGGRMGLIQESATKSMQNTGNPLTRSGLALTGANMGINGKKQNDGTDGILTALEVLALNLEGTDLVTLSACETGVGDIQVGEGVYSLNRAFQEAGAKSVLSTLWSVADEQTMLFMQHFYGLVLNGDSPQQALQKTQLKFINDKTTQDPFFWAAFTVVGI